MSLTNEQAAGLLRSVSQEFSFEYSNNHSANTLIESLSEANIASITEMFNKEIGERELFNLNSILLDSCVTRYRINTAHVTERENRPVHPSMIPSSMNRLLYLVSSDSDLDPIDRAAVAQGGIYYIQPFEDGNKRAGRIIADKILLENELLPMRYDSREEYIDLLFQVSSNLHGDKSRGELLDNIGSFEPLSQYIKRQN